MFHGGHSAASEGARHTRASHAMHPWSPTRTLSLSFALAALVAFGCSSDDSEAGPTGGSGGSSPPAIDCNGVQDFTDCEFGEDTGLCYENDCLPTDCGLLEDGVRCAVSSPNLTGVCADGACDTSCVSNADCGDSQFCATGLCEGGIGVCNERPESCDGEDVSYVCGCDGTTYENACLARQAGLNLRNTGPCVCDSSSVCNGTQFCALETSCINPGQCLPPSVCDPSETNEVCGCDDNTYANECTPFEAGVRVSGEGACGCADNLDCEAGEYCNALVCDGPGNCQPRVGPLCVPDGNVTGCDGVIYADKCAAAEAGQRVRPL